MNPYLTLVKGNFLAHKLLVAKSPSPTLLLPITVPSQNWWKTAPSGFYIGSNIFLTFPIKKD